MTVSELIEKLEKFNDTDVILLNYQDDSENWYVSGIDTIEKAHGNNNMIVISSIPPIGSRRKNKEV